MLYCTVAGFHNLAILSFSRHFLMKFLTLNGKTVSRSSDSNKFIYILNLKYASIKKEVILMKKKIILLLLFTILLVVPFASASIFDCIHSVITGRATEEAASTIVNEQIK